ncbi:MAG: tRNA dihydrouridine synthase, partial [Vulcanimicrobiaceae bacterium]
TENDLVYIDVAKRAQAVGVRAVTLHARTARQFYRGEANWDHIARLKAALDIPVIGNGDLDNARIAVDRMRATGVDAIMLGRATLGNPWLVSQIRDLLEGREMQEAPTPADRLRFCMVHYRTMVEELGESRAVPQMRKHVALYLKGIPGAAILRERIMRTPTAQESLALIQGCIDRLESDASLAA